MQLCAVQSEATDEEFKLNSVHTLAYLAHAQMAPQHVPHLLTVADQVCRTAHLHDYSTVPFADWLVFCSCFPPVYLLFILVVVPLR